MRDASLRFAVAAWIHCSLVLSSGGEPSVKDQLKRSGTGSKQIVTGPEARRLAAHAKIQPEESAQNAELLLRPSPTEGVTGLLQDVDGQGDLVLLRVRQGNGHPSGFHNALIFQEDAQLGGVVGQLDKVNFNLLDHISLSDRHVDNARDVGEALRLDLAMSLAVAIEAVGEAVRSSHGG